MQLFVGLSLPSNYDQAAIDAWLETGRRLEIQDEVSPFLPGEVVTAAARLGVITNGTDEMAAPPPPPPNLPVEDESATEAEVKASEPAGAPRRGRKSNAQKAAEAAAATAAPPIPYTPAVPHLAVVPPITMAAPAQVTLSEPEPMAIPPAAMAVPPPAAPIPVAVPMPVAAPTHSPNGNMTIEELNQAILQIQNAKPGIPHIVMSTATWGNGEPHDRWYAATAIPPELRARFVQEMQAKLFS